MRKRRFRKKKYVRCYKCGKVSRLFRCKYCGNYFCGICSDAKMPLTPNMVFNEKDPVLGKLYEEEWRKGGHACVSYGERKLNEIKERERELTEKVWEALDRMKKIPAKRPSIFRPFSRPTTRPLRRIPVKPIVTIIILIVIGLFVYENFETISGIVTGMFSTITSSYEAITSGNEETIPYYEITTPYSGCSVIQIQYNYYNSEQDSKNAIDYLNGIREKYGKHKIAFDSRLYRLATARAKDMRENNYLDHVNPTTGECAESMKYDFGFMSTDIIAENAGGNPEYSEGSCTEIEMRPMTQEIDDWMESRGHRYNLLYDEHIAGAVGCYKNMCIFLGMHHNFYGLGGGGKCYTAEEGTTFWETATPQPGEVNP